MPHPSDAPFLFFAILVDVQENTNPAMASYVSTWNRQDDQNTFEEILTRKICANSQNSYTSHVPDPHAWCFVRTTQNTEEVPRLLLPLVLISVVAKKIVTMLQPLFVVLKKGPICCYPKFNTCTDTLDQQGPRK
eukprot:scaffold5048_cov121-Cylindrotheca_fusiformis.AAC.18